ncbi:MAG: glutamine synthetase type III [Clostridiales bacterium]|nr:glutamine synthetase type III [Clostridiales bacterium]
MALTEEVFGINVFNDAVMRQRLPKETYRALHATIDNGLQLDPQVASVVANAMKDWALEKGATHYTHWFQPLNSVTAEKHDAFISPLPGGRVISEFSGRELVRGEADASSLPSGGLRSTFEARGYTAWDPTSYAFIKDHILCIPTAYCSYGGEALDKKTPLLRSMEALSCQAVRVLHLFGRTDAVRVTPTVGPEQEYFLVDRALFDRRSDLIFTGRTLFGAKAPKGQELGDHFFGTIPSRVQAFMAELNEELWKLGVLAKTEHNETAPAQHEMAPIYTIVNVACDHNQLTMEMMKKVAKKHGLVCLLHEKPFAGVNGSGKHNNWSMVSNTGYNLLDPGDSPHESAQFLLFLVAVIKAVDDYQDLLRASVASAGNDHRLGGCEAPPAIISIFLGDELTEILESLEAGKDYSGREKTDMAIGVQVLPKIPKDTTDRNRTSPFAFTGNKFEFRSLGSAASISDANVVLNTIVAESLRLFADELEKASDFRLALHELIVREIRQHRRILFNGNNYADEWVQEAARRGLSRLESTVDALPCYTAAKNVALFETHRVLSAAELRSRRDIGLDSYAKILNIEAETMLMMVRRQILPAVIRYSGDLSSSLLKAKEAGCPMPACSGLLRSLNSQTEDLLRAAETLGQILSSRLSDSDPLAAAAYMHDRILPAMREVRRCADALEEITDKEIWPFPAYDKLLFSI